jgi:2-C-methyl-D-erythritol 2,4-cyclodiphosphate synthase
MKIGIGYDSHRLVKGRRLILGGVEIPFVKGLAGHSDADVLSHAIIDAMIGAMGLGDIGKHFPDTDNKWKDASSIKMLKNIVDIVYVNGYEILSIDSVIIAEEPKLSPYIEEMKKNISSTGIPIKSINIKSKTNEGMGFIGKGEGISAFAVCLIMKSIERN